MPRKKTRKEHLLKSYHHLNKQIDRLEMLRQILRTKLINNFKEGTYESEHFTLDIETYQQERAAALECFIARFGRAKLRGLIRHLEVTQVSVKKKGA